MPPQRQKHISQNVGISLTSPEAGVASTARVVVQVPAAVVPRVAAESDRKRRRVNDDMRTSPYGCLHPGARGWVTRAAFTYPVRYT